MAEMVWKCLVMVTLAAIKTGPVVAQSYPPLLGFQCQPSSDQSGLVYTPNIPDSFFSHENAAYTRSEDILDEEFMYIYTIPAESAERDCRGIATALEYCYTTNISSKGSRINVFNFLVLTQEGRHFTINDRFRIRSTPLSTKCEAVTRHTQHTQLVCCDRANIATSRFEVTQSPVTIGVLGRGAAQVLAIPLKSGDEIHKVRRTNSGTIGFTFTATSSDLETLPMLRLLLDPDLVSTSEPMAPNNSQVNDSSITTSVEDDVFTNEPTSTSTTSPGNFVQTGVFAGAVTVGMLFILIILALIMSLIVSRRKAQKRRPKKHKPPPVVPPRPKLKQKFTLTRNEAYRVPTDTSADGNDLYSTSYIEAHDYTTPMTHNVIQTSPQLLTDSYDYVIPSWI